MLPGMQRRPYRRTRSRFGADGEDKASVTKSLTGAATIGTIGFGALGADLSFLCEADRTEIACAPEAVLAGREVTCTGCGARYRMTVSRAAGTYLILPTQVLQN
jgi:hypothetical protein